MKYVVAALVVVALLGGFVRSWRVEPRRWRGGVMLAGVAWIGFAMLLSALDAVLDGVSWGDATVLTLPWALALVVGVVLVANGWRMIAREGRTLGNLLSFLLGLAVTGATVLGAGLVWSGARPGDGSTALVVLGVVVLLLPGYPALTLLSYLLYCVAYARHRPRPHPAAVVVLGSGLVEGKIPPLLAHRLDAGAAVLHAEHERGNRVLLVPSGGQGHDEPMAEGVAMADYLAQHGVDRDDMLVEDLATTTEENLQLSLDLLHQRGVHGRLRVVTSEYHAGRAALIARRLGVDADVTGAPTAWYFLPSAFVRELAAAVTYHPWVNAAGLLLWAGFTALVAAVAVGA